MRGGTISFILSQDIYTRSLFDGFWFPDLPAELTKIPALIILNTDNSTGPGEHWCAAYISESKHCEFFDPLGAPPENNLLNYSFIPQLSKYSNTIEHNIIPVQHITATTCGPHCLFFCFYRARGISLESILKRFYSSDTHSNDNSVSQFIHNLNKFILPLSK
jgi:hypothetical protein